LLKGVNLIEASAGTGKTYAISHAGFTLVVEQGMTIDKVLVVTFTKAATEELKDVSGAGSPKLKGFGWTHLGYRQQCAGLAANLDIERELVKQRLAGALLDIDRQGFLPYTAFVSLFCENMRWKAGNYLTLN